MDNKGQCRTGQKIEWFGQDRTKVSIAEEHNVPATTAYYFFKKYSTNDERLKAFQNYKRKKPRKLYPYKKPGSKKKPRMLPLDKIIELEPWLKEATLYTRYQRYPNDFDKIFSKERVNASATTRSNGKRILDTEIDREEYKVTGPQAMDILSAMINGAKESLVTISGKKKISNEDRDEFLTSKRFLRNHNGYLEWLLSAVDDIEIEEALIELRVFAAKYAI